MPERAGGGGWWRMVAGGCCCLRCCLQKGWFFLGWQAMSFKMMILLKMNDSTSCVDFPAQVTPESHLRDMEDELERPVEPSWAQLSSVAGRGADPDWCFSVGCRQIEVGLQESAASKLWNHSAGSLEGLEFRIVQRRVRPIWYNLIHP